MATEASPASCLLKPVIPVEGRGRARHSAESPDRELSASTHMLRANYSTQGAQSLGSSHKNREQFTCLQECVLTREPRTSVTVLDSGRDEIRWSKELGGREPSALKLWERDQLREGFREQRRPWE